ncbi:hypothetical protein GGH94_002875 [Coemansia aciculifera]|uniref:Uncharacterized protein n=1 Tax=Coemansia aciculifera TaxID=417176 RepID=A0A9W8M506_9FUNG|nr:hypothetical protein GGH94_002875 [Coemansia aciculifera]KAJ2873037.1 hypothetical protein GGH93_003549 [Coemansia aciculifera]
MSLNNLEWDVAIYGIPRFDGTNSILTKVWLDNVERCFPPASPGKDIRGIPYQDAENFNPEIAYARLTADITSGKRYIGLGDIKAIELAGDDHDAILAYCGAERSDLAPAILIVLSKVFPPAARIDFYGDFDKQISSIRAQINP